MSVTFPLDALLESLKTEEGFRARAYKCTTGHLTVGYGRNIDESGLGVTEEEASYLLKNDVVRTIKELQLKFIWFDELGKNQREALVELCFQLGLTRLSKFVKMLEALKQKNYDDAATELLDSKYATQVSGRANRLANKLRG